MLWNLCAHTILSLLHNFTANLFDGPKLSVRMTLEFNRSDRFIFDNPIRINPANSLALFAYLRMKLLFVFDNAYSSASLFKKVAWVHLDKLVGQVVKTAPVVGD